MWALVVRLCNERAYSCLLLSIRERKGEEAYGCSFLFLMAVAPSRVLHDARIIRVCECCSADCETEAKLIAKNFGIVTASGY